MIRQKALLRKQKAAARKRRQLLLAALCLVPSLLVLALGAPLSQYVRVVEIESAGTEAAPQKSYRLMLPAELDELARNAAKSAGNSGKSAPKNKAPKLLKPVAEQWERVSRVEVESAEIPAQLLPLVLSDANETIIPQFSETLYLTHSPPGPFSTGPPCQA